MREESPELLAGVAFESKGMAPTGGGNPFHFSGVTNC